MLGDRERRYPAPLAEQAALRDLARGAFVREPVRAGETIHHSNVFFAMPNVEDQLVAQDFSKYSEYVAVSEIPAQGAVMRGNVEARNTRELVHKIVSDVKNLIRKSKVQVPGQCDLEISHHYGLERFREFGITAITVVNREYCKRLMVVLPGQKHPEQWHNQKDETYHVLYGDVTVNLEGKERTLKGNDVVTIAHGEKHSFWTAKGAIIEEVSSSYSRNDSFYTDPAIMANTSRKTFVTYWIG
jgi:mannose-6-phosphate isomerase-like protein (cupin superfamily)